MHLERSSAEIRDPQFCSSVMEKTNEEDHSGSEESDESAGSGSVAPPGAGEVSDRDERAVEAQNVPEGSGASTESPSLPTFTPFFQPFGADNAVIDEPMGVIRNGVVLEVTKKDGRKQPLKAFKLRARINRLMKGLNAEFVSPELVVQKVVAGAYNNVKTAELDALMAETAAYLATDHPDYSMLAARVSVSALHKRTDASFAATVKALHEYVHPETRTPSKKIADDVAAIVAANAQMLDAAVRYDRDFHLDYFGYKTLEKAYLLRMNGVPVERPQHMFMRVAVGIHKQDLEAALETYELMSDKFFTHATPTLFNAGTPHSQLSSCFLLQSGDDSISGIYASLAKCAKISSEAGGIGIAVHNIRARGSYMHSTHGAANGLVPMLRVFNATARLCDQGAGKRPGAFAVYLEPWHAEVLEFLELKKNTGSEETRARDLFYALWMPDLLMERCLEDGNWSLFCPSEAAGLADCYGAEFKALYERYEAEGKARRVMKARELWFAILEAQIENGTPYLLYKDACNAKSNQQNLGVIKCSNLCTEIVEYTAPDEVAVCNLASVCLPRFLRDGKFDHQLLFQVVSVMARNLNKIIDINSYPVEEARRSNMRHRPIGIGVQGLADVFLLLRLPFESDTARVLNREVFETIYFAAMSTSSELAGVHGPYETFAGSPASRGLLQFDLWGVEPSARWDWAGLKERIKRVGLRNSLTVAPMPTASTAQIMGNAECFEPYTSNFYFRRVMAGDFPVVNPHMLHDLTRLRLWSPEMKHRVMAADGSIQGIAEIPAEIKALYKTAWEIKQRCLIDMAADRGAFIDQSQSLNLFMEAPTVAKLTSMHFYTWKKGLKTGVYYLRTRAAVDAIKFTVDHHTVVEARQARSTNSPLPAAPPSASSDGDSDGALGAGEGGAARARAEEEGRGQDAEAVLRQKREEARLRREEARRRCAQDGDSCLMCGS